MAGKARLDTRIAGSFTRSATVRVQGRYGNPALRLVLLSSFVGAGAGCSLIYADQPTQCSVDADCSDLEGGESLTCTDEGLCVDPSASGGSGTPGLAAWDCLETGEKLVSVEPVVTQDIQLINIVTGRPPEGVEALVCQKFDEACESPSERLQADENGTLTFAANAGFDGYVEIVAEEIMPSRVQFFNVTDQGRTTTPALIPRSAISLIASASAVQYDPAGVTVLMELSDCTGRPVSRATGSTEDGTDSTAIRYLVNQVPSTTQETTSEDGLVALFNLEPGSITLSGVREDGVVFATESIIVPAGYVVYLGLRPNQ